MRILIAEDDEASRMILEAAVGQLGHESVSANDGAEGLRGLSSLTPTAPERPAGHPALAGCPAALQTRDG